MSSVALLYCNGGCPGIVSYFGVHGITKELQRQRQKRRGWSVLTIFSHEKGEAVFASDCKEKGMRRLSPVRGASYEPVVLLGVSAEPR